MPDNQGEQWMTREAVAGNEPCSNPYQFSSSMRYDLDILGMQSRIAEVRKARNMSLEDVAKASGVAKPHVWALEKGKSQNPSVRSVWGLSRALGVSPAWLLGMHPDSPDLDPLALEVSALIERRLADRENSDA